VTGIFELFEMYLLVVFRNFAEVPLSAFTPEATPEVSPPPPSLIHTHLSTLKRNIYFNTNSNSKVTADF